MSTIVVDVGWERGTTAAAAATQDDVTFLSTLKKKNKKKTFAQMTLFPKT